MLFPGLQREREGLSTVRVAGESNDSARREPDVLLPTGEQTQQGSAARRRDAEGLTLADHDVRAPAPRRLEHGQSQRVCGDGQWNVAQYRFQLEEALVHHAETIRQVCEESEDPRLATAARSADKSRRPVRVSNGISSRRARVPAR